MSDEWTNSGIVSKEIKNNSAGRILSARVVRVTKGDKIFHAGGYNETVESVGQE